MRTIIVTGSAGLIGSEAVRRFANDEAHVVGIDNDMRAQFFGAEASTRKTRDNLIANVRGYTHHDLDIRNASAVADLFKSYSGKIDAIVHTASQPSHDWAARDPQTDFTINANRPLNLLEAARTFFPEAPFVFTSTNNVYGDTPNQSPLQELPTRWEIEPGLQPKRSCECCHGPVSPCSPIHDKACRSRCISSGRKGNHAAPCRRVL